MLKPLPLEDCKGFVNEIGKQISFSKYLQALFCYFTEFRRVTRVQRPVCTPRTEKSGMATLIPELSIINLQNIFFRTKLQTGLI